MTDRGFAPRGPAEIQDFLATKRGELSSLENELQEAHEDAENALIEWMQHYDGVVADLEDEADGKKLPGEEVRVSIARRRGGWEKWTALTRAERAVKKLEKRASLISTQVGAAQSEGKLMGVV